MDKVTPTRLILGATALLAITVVPVALAATDGGSQATPSAVSAAKFKKLTKQIKQLKKQIKRLQADVAALQTQAPVPGPQGDPGATGPPGLSDVETVLVISANDPSTPKALFPPCPGGKRVIAAGGSVGTLPADDGEVFLTKAFPLSTNQASVEAREVAGSTTGNWSLTAYATCANVG